MSKHKYKVGQMFTMDLQLIKAHRGKELNGCFINREMVRLLERTKTKIFSIKSLEIYAYNTYNIKELDDWLWPEVSLIPISKKDSMKVKIKEFKI